MKIPEIENDEELNPSSKEVQLNGDEIDDTTNLKQQAEINLNKRKINISLIVSILALLVSAIQLVLTSPYFLDSYSEPTITATEKWNYIIKDNKKPPLYFR